jgi:hypothetical protein
MCVTSFHPCGALLHSIMSPHSTGEETVRQDVTCLKLPGGVSGRRLDWEFVQHLLSQPSLPGQSTVTCKVL